MENEKKELEIDESSEEGTDLPIDVDKDDEEIDGVSIDDEEGLDDEEDDDDVDEEDEI